MHSSNRFSMPEGCIDCYNLLHDPPAPAVDRRQLHPHPIADQHPHEIAVDPIRDVRRHLRALVEPHPIQRARQLLTT